MRPTVITGFEPFNNEPVNPTQKLVEQLTEDLADDSRIVTAVLPVDTVIAPERLTSLLERHQPRTVLLMGLASGRSTLSIERVAINVLDFNIADNAGNRLQDRPIAPDGPAAYFATLPIRAIKEQLCAAGIPAALSNSAGTYLCNQVMYTALHWAARRKPASHIGFLHVPALPEEVAERQRPGPSMAFDTMLAGVRMIVDILDDEN